MHKKRGYKRDLNEKLLRDYKLFAIACEGSKREPAYFSLFQFMSNKIAVDIITDVVSDDEMQMKSPDKSAPKWVLDRAARYIEKEGLSDEDDLWFVIDKDRWSDAQIREIANYCNDYPNWNIVISNPCFEVWLYFHKSKKIQDSKSVSCNDFKNELSEFIKGGYNPLTWIPDISSAIVEAKNRDHNPNHFMPDHKESKIYKLAEALMSYIGQKSFDAFLNGKLKKLLSEEKAKMLKRTK